MLRCCKHTSLSAINVDKGPLLLLNYKRARFTAKAQIFCLRIAVTLAKAMNSLFDPAITVKAVIFISLINVTLIQFESQKYCNHFILPY